MGGVKREYPELVNLAKLADFLTSGFVLIFEPLIRVFRQVQYIIIIYIFSILSLGNLQNSISLESVSP